MAMKAAMALGTLLSVTPAVAEPVRCTWTEKVQCDPGMGCTAQPVRTWATIDLAARRYQRCDRLGCDTYDAHVTRSGIYYIVDLPGRGVFAKLGADGQGTEVISLGRGVLVSHGRCRAARN